MFYSVTPFECDDTVIRRCFLYISGYMYESPTFSTEKRDISQLQSLCRSVYITNTRSFKLQLCLPIRRTIVRMWRHTDIVSTYSSRTTYMSS